MLFRSVLGALLFSGSSVDKKIKVLSGGERNRVALAKVLVQHANLLLLDEPTNHLDLLTKQVLADALAEYQGTLIFVSHDRDIVEKVATAIVSIDHGVVTYYPGTYESFLFAREQQGVHAATATAKKKAVVDKPQASGGQQRERRKQLQRVEREISKAEEREAKATERMGAHEYG